MGKLLALAGGVILLSGARAAPTAAASTCLTPEVGKILGEIVAGGGLQPVLRDKFTLQGTAISADHIELHIADQQHQVYTITLAVPGSKPGTPDGEGSRFQFYLTTSPNDEAATALLAAATVFDRAIPAAMLEGCAANDQHHTPPGWDRRCPRALALSSAIVQVAIVLATVVFGLCSVGWRSRVGA